MTALVLTLLLASDASPPDAPDPGEIRALASALQTVLAGDELLSQPAELQVILSAMRCEAIEREAATRAQLERGVVPRVASDDFRQERKAAAAERALYKSLNLAVVQAAADVEAAHDRLEVLEIEPLPCRAYAVNHLAVCLGAPVATRYCEREQHVAAQVAAAERLAEVRQ